MQLLSRAEEIILLAVLKLGDEAYGVSIRDQVHADIGRRWSFGVIYKTLKKMGTKDFVNKRPSPPIAERGGRSRYYYEITQEGISALREIQNIHSSLWAGVRMWIGKE
jgi:DNA-binding PadR family transcriptional regulator